MPLDEDLLRSARRAGARQIDAQHQLDIARADYHHAVRRLHVAGGSLRDIAAGLDLSHQRVHQIIEAGGGTRGWRPRKRAGAVLECSFCGLAQDQVSKLVAGPGVYICEGCVRLAWQVAQDAQPVETDRIRLEPASPGHASCCSFCAKSAAQVTSLVIGPGVCICDSCLRFCEEIIANDVQHARTDRAD